MSIGRFISKEYMLQVFSYSMSDLHVAVTAMGWISSSKRIVHYIFVKSPPREISLFFYPNLLRVIEV